MLSKLVCHAATREDAIARMKRALTEYRVEGIETTIPFFTVIMDHPDFKAAQFDTGFIDRILPLLHIGRPSADEQRVTAAIAAAAIIAFENAQRVQLPIEEESRWKHAGRIEAMRGRP
jgi:acetyl-CoA carboxylase biotin carboxylase subunit